jgi:hypothetical protein
MAAQRRWGALDENTRRGLAAAKASFKRRRRKGRGKWTVKTQLIDAGLRTDDRTGSITHTTRQYDASFV